MHNISQLLIIIFLFSCRNLPCAMLISHIRQSLFFIANSPKTSFFSACNITPVNFIDTFLVLMSSTFIPYLRVSVTHEVYMYQLTSSQTHKMAMKNSQR